MVLKYSLQDLQVGRVRESGDGGRIHGANGGVGRSQEREGCRARNSIQVGSNNQLEKIGQIGHGCNNIGNGHAKEAGNQDAINRMNDSIRSQDISLGNRGHDSVHGVGKSDSGT
jgi:hypothetical protein